MEMNIIPANRGGPGMDRVFFKRVRGWRLHLPPLLQSTAIPSDIDRVSQYLFLIPSLILLLLRERKFMTYM